MGGFHAWRQVLHEPIYLATNSRLFASLQNSRSYFVHALVTGVILGQTDNRRLKQLRQNNQIIAVDRSIRQFPGTAQDSLSVDIKSLLSSSVVLPSSLSHHFRKNVKIFLVVVHKKFYRQDQTVSLLGLHQVFHAVLLAFPQLVCPSLFKVDLLFLLFTREKFQRFLRL